MTDAILAIKQWDNNLGVRLPAAVAREAHLHVDQRVRISVEATFSHGLGQYLPFSGNKPCPG